MTQHVTFFGELLLRLDTPDHQRFAQANSFQATFTGGEANVAVALSQWGNGTSLLSAVPENEIGQACLNHLRRYGVDVSQVLRIGSRLGILFVEAGAGQRGARVIYDRDHTSFRGLQPGLLDWERVLANAAYFHLTGTALVAEGTRELLLQGLDVARKLGVSVSFDFSYRSSLWSIDAAREAFLQVIPSVNLLIGSEQDALTFLGIQETGDACFPALAAKYGVQWTAFSDRQLDEAGRNFYSAKLYDGQQILRSSTYPTTAVDRIGTGDAFAAGLLHGLLHQRSPQWTLDYATAAAVLKHTIPGDFALLSTTEIESLMHGQGIGKVQR